MINKFRTLYPQGSLISELIKIECGKYIVRAVVQIGEVTLASGLAAAETIELAEDRARIRAIEAIALDILDTLPETVKATATEPVNTVVSTPEPIMVKPPVEAPAPSEAKVTTSTTKKSRKSKEKTTKVENLESSQNEEKILLEDRSASVTSEVSAPEVELESFKASDRSDEQLATSWLDTPEENEVEDSLDNSNIDRSISESFLTYQQETQATEQGNLFDEPLNYSYSPTATVEKTSLFGERENNNLDSQPRSTATEDSSEASFTDLKAQTSVEMKRLGWTNSQGREFLQTNYGKLSRDILTISELREFLEYLQNLPTP
jgi:hypothetical protein